MNDSRARRERIGSDVIYWSSIHAPANEHGIGPTAAYLLSRRPCRVIIETDNRTSPNGRGDERVSSRGFALDQLFHVNGIRAGLSTRRGVQVLLRVTFSGQGSH